VVNLKDIRACPGSIIPLTGLNETQFVPLPLKFPIFISQSDKFLFLNLKWILVLIEVHVNDSVTLIALLGLNWFSEVNEGLSLLNVVLEVEPLVSSLLHFGVSLNIAKVWNGLLVC
jgi:hypothetical protein